MPECCHGRHGAGKEKLRSISRIYPDGGAGYALEHPVRPFNKLNSARQEAGESIIGLLFDSLEIHSSPFSTFAHLMSIIAIMNSNRK